MQQELGLRIFLVLAFLIRTTSGTVKTFDQLQWDTHANRVSFLPAPSPPPPSPPAIRDNEIFPSADDDADAPVPDVRQVEAPLPDQLFDRFATATQLAIDQCQRQFRWLRWNCPKNAFASSRHGRRESTRESAFVAAITAAAVVHSITRNCSRGDLIGCGCHSNPADFRPSAADEPVGTWAWGGCSDNVARGEHVAERMMSAASEKGVDAHVYAYLHNSRVGRDVVRESVQKHCKCHGLSGSCTVKTCWLELGAFADVGAVLKRRYNRAIRADFASKKGQLYSGNSDRSSETDAMQKFVRKSKSGLVYISASPDYCQANFTSGWAGTKGRVCDKTDDSTQSPEQRRSCRTLCRACGHRVERRRRDVVSHCKCSFNWCCSVKCETCRKTVVERFCA